MKQLVIYDDFYSEPVGLRNLVLNMAFEGESSGNYPGKNSTFKHFSDDMIPFFKHLTGEDIRPVETSHNGGFRIQNAGEKGKQYIHVDLPSPSTSWSGICYLTPPEYYTKEDGTCLDSGTKLWKHKSTGMESLPYNIKYLESIGIKGWDDLKSFMDTEGMDESKWINTMSVPIKFNRLVLFRSNLWHSQGELFGNTLEDGRLIQTFFFEPNE